MWRLGGHKVVAPAGAPAGAVPAAAEFTVRPRLTRGELAALVVAIAGCLVAVGYEFGWRRPMQEAAAVASAKPRAMQALSSPSRPATSSTPAAATGATTRTANEIVEIEVIAPADSAVPSLGRDDPFRKPGTLYRCRRYDGSAFWTDLHCGQHRGALIERIAKVPPELPFDQQVRIARDDAKRFESSLASEQAELQRMNTCATLVGERAQILRRAGDATVLNQVHANDRARAREIDATLQRMRCGG